VILEDNGPDTYNPEAAAVSALVDAGADSAFGLSKPIDWSDHEAWYDVEAGCYVDEELRPFPLLEQEGLASTLAQGQPHSRYHPPGPSHEQIGQYDDDRNTQCTLEELKPHTLPKPLDEDGGRGREENISELERDMLLAFEEQEKSSSPTAPSSPRPHRHSTKPSHSQIDQELDQSGTSYGRLEGLRHGSPLRSQDQEEEELQEQQRQQQQQEVAADAMGEVEDDDGEPEQGKRGEKRRRQDRTEEVSSDIHQSEGSDCSHNITDEDGEDDEDDEEPRPAKRRKLPSAPTHKALTPPLDHNSKARLRQPHNITPPLATQLEVDDTLSQADPVDDEHHISRTSRSPSAPTESVPIAEYQEWPFHGFLKRTKIGNETTYNLEFKLPCREAPAKAAIPNEAAAHSKIYPAALRPQIKRAPWTPEEDVTLLKMRNEGCSWEDIHAALPHRSKGTIQVRYSKKLKR